MLNKGRNYKSLTNKYMTTKNTELSLTDKLIKIQAELKAPKNQKNNFGKYNYRSCEDILEAVKPLLNKYNIAIKIRDNIEMIGDRYYVKATVIIGSGKDITKTNAYAREVLERKGMDESQITGATSSYARKYALNGMFAIDDSKDADTMDKPKEQDVFETTKKAINSAKKVETLKLYEEKIYESKKLTDDQRADLVEMIESKKEELI